MKNYFLVPVKNKVLCPAGPMICIAIEEGRAASKRPHYKFDYFLFYVLACSFCRYHSKFSCKKYFPQKQKEHRQSSESTDKVITMQIWKLIHICPLSNFKIQLIVKLLTRQTEGKNLVWFGEIERN
jgi:hypothetical protein